MSELTISINSEVEAALRNAAGERGVDLKEYVEDALESLVSDAPQAAKPIWERIVDAASAIPEDERKRLPSDASENLDHYLYGASRKT